MNEKDPSGRNECANERNVWATRGSQDHGHTLQEGQGSVFTNQCLGKERMLILPS